ncbi:exopolyphosphatase / guanosine-5'-triphosphate,3'-diphosphate pyrophosphatase [Raineyella antarctica]|uniref:Exopolyphosphatase / guanosine-5'-triphosphate,3'-diphosphate pyrophosphatase n=1 Tax=Raineyella antarctica TaxID=1577474 RepID=A0A1G6GE31_9ACTN|nr:Ppx/GppA phosphatase family protein [Raineyella antarctica]SDB80224.1 exopolyphosphatase / guanosine-5'-triphosphate,3'-diphosphate pyrophosphatase [Raineyella antarctica]
MRLGVLDVGSNTVHLLVVDARVGGPPVPAASHKRLLRLAEHITSDEMLSEEGTRVLVDMVEECKEFAESTGCSKVLPFVTSALREASNTEEVVQHVKDRTGVQLKVLSGQDEARATFLAVRRWYGWSAGRLGVLDIGGGSLEMACGSDEEPEVAISVPVGAGRMYRMFKDEGGAAACRRHVRAEIGAVVGELLRRSPFDRWVATSKTFRSLGRITGGAAPSSEGPYVRRQLHLADLHEWVERLAEMSPAQRAELPGVSKDRAAQLLAGAIVAEAAMELAGVESVELCPWASREGIILNHLDHLQYWQRDGLRARSLHHGEGEMQAGAPATL